VVAPLEHARAPTHNGTEPGQGGNVDRSRARRLAGPAPVTLVLVLVLAAVGCGGDGDGGGGGQDPAPEQPPDPATARFDLTIGDLLPLSGELAPFGPPGRKAAELAVEQARDALEEAKVDGVGVNMRDADTQTNPQASVTAARRLVSGGATCLTGAWASAETIAVAQQVATPDRVPLISPATTSAQMTTLGDDGFALRTAPSNTLQGETLADVVEDELGGVNKTIAVAGRNDAYGQGLAQGFRRAWEAKGGKVTGGPILYDPEQPDYKEEAERILADDPDGYVIVDFPDTYARVGKALTEIDEFDAGKLFVTDGLAGQGLPREIPGDALEGARGIRPGTPVDGPAAKAFDLLYSRSKLEPKDRQTFDAQNFDANILCFLTAVAAGSKEGEDIQGKLRDVSAPPGEKFTFERLAEAVKRLRRGEEIDYQGASGPIDLDGQGDPTFGTYEVFEYGSNRDFEVLRQVQAKTGQGIYEAPSGDRGARDGGSDGGGGSEAQGDGGGSQSQGGGGGASAQESP
jgi:ABC-type branched-subunit amino acid transport system substrate-binding protein